MRFALVLTLLLLPILPAFGSGCFCLVDTDDTLWFDCREQPRPMRTQPLVFCTDSATGDQVELTGRPDLERVADGEAPCTPCRLSDAARIDHTLRGGGDAQDAAGGSEDAAATGTPPTAPEDRP